jgi:regulation of enolase protein 1 (concanavalin A-like superfamily)
MNKLMHRAAMIAGAIVAALSLHAQDKTFPGDANLINVKTAYGAKGDGVSDDTAAIRNAIRNNIGGHRTIFFPAGTYVVSEQIDFKANDGQWAPWITLQGEGMGRTTIRLKDNSAGFGSASTPKPILRFGSSGWDPACSSYNQPNGDGGGNCAFGHYMFDMTVHSGSGNPGAIGVDYIASNYGAVENLRIVSGDGQGVIGLGLKRAVGPALIKNVYVQGFQHGIESAGELYSITFEYITLVNQSVAGVKNHDNAVIFRKVTSTNSVPAFLNSGIGLLTVIDSSFSGGSSTRSAIENTGHAFIRNVTSSGYQSAIKNGSTVVSGANATEWVSAPIKSLFPSPAKSLGLAIQDTPSFHDNNMANWANVTAYGAVSGDGADDSAAIQAAIDSGKTTVYFPHGYYTVNSTVIIRGNVRRIYGFESDIAGSANPKFRVAALNNASVIIEKMRFNNGTIEHSSAQNVVLKHTVGAAPRDTSSSGAWFLENYCCGNLYVTNQNVWARQLNIEGGDPLAINHGGNMWILGYKTEGAPVTLKTAGGGKTELLGGILYTVWGSGNPALVNDESSLSATFTETSYSDGANYDNYVQEKRDGVTRSLSRTEAQWHGYGGMMPLYVGYKVAPGAGTGLTGEYFDNIDLTALKLTRVDPTINFNWGDFAPDSTVGVDTFSVRWTGKIEPQYSETYTFHATTDNGRRLWVNNQLIIDQWVDDWNVTYTGTIALTAGQKYDIKMEYFENYGGASALLEWSSPSQARQVIPQSQLFPAGLPSPWQAIDIGAPGVAGTTVHSAGVFTAEGSGADIWGTSDQFRYVYQSASGDCEIKARVTSQENTDGWAKAGVMIRESTGANSKHAFLTITPANGFAFQNRTATGGSSANTAGGALNAAPNNWVRLVRSGSTITAYKSSNGTSWTTVGSVTVSMTSNVQIGLAVTSHNNATLGTAVFDNVTVVP